MARTEAIRIIFERPCGGEANNVPGRFVHPNKFHLPNSFYRRLKAATSTETQLHVQK
jgi:hypothetical protein